MVFILYLIIGLGNPGRKYAGSRHNLGFQVIEALSRRLKIKQPVQKHWSLIASAQAGGQEIALVQPLTYMNLSGRAAGELVRKYNPDLDNLLVIYDDLDLPPGVLRFRKGGSSAGHRGMQSIIDTLGTREFPRLKIGIGRPAGDLEVADYVLRRPPPDEKVLLEEAVTIAVDAVLLYISDGVEAAMNYYNQGLSSTD